MPDLMRRSIPAAPGAAVPLLDGTLVKADRRTNFGPSVIGDPSVPGANSLTTWGERIARPLTVVDPGTPLAVYRGNIGALDPLKVWRSQPSVRKVVDFIARNIATVPFHVYQRAGDNDRVRRADSPAERALRQPQRFRSGFQLWRDVVTDSCMWDAWCVAYMQLPGDAAERLYRISPRLLKLDVGPLGTIERVGIVDRSRPGGVLDITDVPLAIGTGWADTGAGGVSPMTTLAAILTEQANAVEWRNRKWVTSPKSGGLLKRPPAAESGRWEPKDREAFLSTWRSWRDGTADGTPILEDGMDYQVLSTLNPVDAKDIEGRQLTDAEVASAFHIAPELVGARQGTFSNVAAFRAMLYGPALGPRMTDLADAVNAPGGLVQALDDTDGLYAEQDREAAMAGSFADQATYLQTAVGGPFMTRAEGRAKLNLPFIEGTDELITPLNVTEGGQASPTDSGSQNEDPAAEPSAPAPSDGKSMRRKAVAKTAVLPSERDALRDALAEHLRRMALDLPESGVGDPLAFHQAWDESTAKTLRPHLGQVSEAQSRDVLRQLDAPDDAWSVDAQQAYLDAMANTHAGRAVSSVVDKAAEPWGETGHAGLVAAVMAGAGVLAATALADASGFGGHDAAHAAKATQKTWQAGARARSSHAGANGETVELSKRFSLGVRWPGDSEGDAEQTAGCNCSITYSTKD